MKGWRGIVAVALAFLALGAGADELKEGLDFRLIKPPLTTEANKIEVTEFFWYGCPYCFDLEPELVAWVKKLPADVSFRRVPAIFPDKRGIPGANLYFTLEAMNLLERLHDEAFNAIHVERQRLDDGKRMLEWVAKKGVDPKQFNQTMASFGVQSRVKQAFVLTQSAGVTAVPGVMVQGRYLVLAQRSNQAMLANIEQLVARVRAEADRNKR